MAALGHTIDDNGESHDRVIAAADLEVAALDRTRVQARKFLPGSDPPASRCSWATAAVRRPADDVGDGSGGASGGVGLSYGDGADDPSDPTDLVSGAVAPLEDPVTGEPPVAPPS